MDDGENSGEDGAEDDKDADADSPVPRLPPGWISQGTRLDLVPLSRSPLPAGASVSAGPGVRSSGAVELSARRDVASGTFH